jgi:hypothetical protein
MYIYGKCGNVFALYLELSPALGKTPWLDINTCNNETIIDIPYGQIILTTRAALLGETGSVNRYEQRNGKISSHPARNAKTPP